MLYVTSISCTICKRVVARLWGNAPEDSIQRAIRTHELEPCHTNALARLNQAGSAVRLVHGTATPIYRPEEGTK